MNNNEMKKYFLSDKEITSFDEDKFNQKDIVNNIELIMENSNTPYNIALIGKNGIGKSSITNMLLEKYKNDSDKYIVQEINVWKNEEESLKDIFVKELCEKANVKNEKKSYNLNRVYNSYRTDKIEEEKSENNNSFDFKQIVIQIILIFILALSIIFPLYVIYKFIADLIVNGGIMDSFFKDTFVAYFKNIKTLLIFPIIISAIYVLKKYLAIKNNKVEINFNPTEVGLSINNINEAIKEIVDNKKDKKIITVIEDIDKLDSNKIVETLDMLKSLDKLNNCIFIVSFDDEIIHKALDNSRNNNNCKVIENKEILEKIFEYKVYIPSLLDFNLKQYAVDLVNNEIPDFTNEFCEIGIFEKVIKKVLIHRGVDTPRQVKRIINNFVNNKILITKRNENGRIEKGLLDDVDFDSKLAKMSVLQSEFGEFYNILFKNFNYIHTILEIHDNEVDYSNLDDTMKKFFYMNKVTKCAEIKPEYETLINFLKSTEKYKITNLAPYMYLIQDEVSVKLGDENSKRLISALESNNSVTVRKIITENFLSCDTIIYHLENIDDNESLNSVITMINVFDCVLDSKKEIIAELIVEKIHYLGLFKNEKETIKEVNFKNLFSILLLKESAENIQSILAYNIDEVNAQIFDKKCDLEFAEHLLELCDLESRKAVFNRFLIETRYREINVEKIINEENSVADKNIETEDGVVINVDEENEEKEVKIAPEEVVRKVYDRYIGIFAILCVADNKELILEYIASIIENYNMNSNHELFFEFINNLIEMSKRYLTPKLYTRYLKMVALNYELYPERVIEIFKKIKSQISDDIMKILLDKFSVSVNEENFDDLFLILRSNSDGFYVDSEVTTAYVSFLVNNIGLAEDPNEIIEELDDNFTRISKVYELNKNIQNLEKIDLDFAYDFFAKCFDNGNVDRMIVDFNKMLLDEDSAEMCLDIESRMENYSLKDVVEYDVDCIDYMDSNSNENDEENKDYIEYAKKINNYTMLKNLLIVSVSKQDELAPIDVIKVLQYLLGCTTTDDQKKEVYEILNGFDKSYFYENRRDFVELLYNYFHLEKNNTVKYLIIDCIKNFKGTRLFKNKLTKQELNFFNKKRK